MRQLAVIVFFAVGVVTLIGAVLLYPSDPLPPARGEVGEIAVFGQLPAGPVRLTPDRLRRLPRPQDFAFQFTSKGEGPRYLRVEMEAEGVSSVVYEDRIGAPKEKESLEFVLRVGDDYPDHIGLVVTIEAPHAMSVIRRYPIELVGPERPFWEKE